MLRTSRESSDSDEEPEHEQAYLVWARMEQPIVDVKVDIPLADVKSVLIRRLSDHSAYMLSSGIGTELTRQLRVETTM